MPGAERALAQIPDELHALTEALGAVAARIDALCAVGLASKADLSSFSPRDRETVADIVIRDYRFFSERMRAK